MRARACMHAGDQWTLNALGIVILCGMLASLIPLCIKLVVHDKFTLGAEAEAITEFLPPQDGGSGGQNASESKTEAGVKGRSQHLPVVHSGVELRLDADTSPEHSKMLPADQPPHIEGSGSGPSLLEARRGSGVSPFSGSENTLQSSPGEQSSGDSAQHTTATAGNTSQVRRHSF